MMDDELGWLGSVAVAAEANISRGLVAMIMVARGRSILYGGSKGVRFWTLKKIVTESSSPRPKILMEISRFENETN